MLNAYTYQEEREVNKIASAVSMAFSGEDEKKPTSKTDVDYIKRLAEWAKEKQGPRPEPKKVRE